MEFAEAVPLVVADRRQGREHMTVGEALHDAWDAVPLEDLVENNDDLTVAYRVVLAELERKPLRFHLIELVTRLAGEGVVQLTPLQEFWVYCARVDELV
jgi:hypothetical protein